MVEHGASGGVYETGNDNSGTGGGGYPAAGIGGGGAGGGGANHINGGGGYSAGMSEDMRSKSYTAAANGTTGGYIPTGIYSNGGSYFEHGKVSASLNGTRVQYSANVGGQGAGDYQYSNSVTDCYVGSGGIAGNGGTIKVSAKATVNAYNGNECTLEKSNSNYYYKPVEIYIQSGNPLNVYIHNGYGAMIRYNILSEALKCTISGFYAATSDSDYKDFVVTKSMRGVSYAATSYGYGIGSGAGYVEVSNGTYTVDNTMN
jgi:hypothetical protein